MDYSPPGSSVQWILQARRLKWVAMPSSRGSSQPRDWIQVLSPSLAGEFFTTIWEDQKLCNRGLTYMWDAQKSWSSRLNFLLSPNNLRPLQWWWESSPGNGEHCRRWGGGCDGPQQSPSWLSPIHSTLLHRIEIEGSYWCPPSTFLLLGIINQSCFTCNRFLFKADLQISTGNK